MVAYPVVKSRRRVFSHCLGELKEIRRRDQKCNDCQCDPQNPNLESDLHSPTTMPRLHDLLPCLFILSVLSSLISAHLIEVAAGKKECFFEDLHINDKMTVTYQVAEGGYLDIDFWVSACHTFLHSFICFLQLTDPLGKTLGKQIRQTTGSYAITAEQDGRHEYCFSNQMSAVADKIVRHVLCLFPRDPLGILTCRLVSMSMALFTQPEMVSPIYPCVESAIDMLPNYRRCCSYRTGDSQARSRTRVGEG